MSESCFSNTKPKILNYIDFKLFSQEAIKEDLSEALCNCGNSYDIVITFLHQSYINVLPKRKKWLKENNETHANKTLCQAIMKRSRLKTKANKTKDLADIRNYNKQENCVVNLNKEAKFEYISKFESNDNEPFWVNCKPYFTNKHSITDTYIMLGEYGELILKNKEIANTYNDHFRSIVDNLSFDHWDYHSLSLTKGSDSIFNIIKRYKHYPSMKNIKAKLNSVRSFTFQPVFMDEVTAVIQYMKNNKSVGGKKPIQILK